MRLWAHVFYVLIRPMGQTLQGTTCVTQSSGGGGTSNDMPWRDKDEDFLHSPISSGSMSKPFVNMIVCTNECQTGRTHMHINNEWLF